MNYGHVCVLLMFGTTSNVDGHAKKGGGCGTKINTQILLRNTKILFRYYLNTFAKQTDFYDTNNISKRSLKEQL